ncbi:oligoribonuclease [Vitreoscilla stercoraria]
MNKMANASNLVWLDMEMTGLDPNKERIIEVAMIVTDNELNTIAQSPILTVHQSDELLNAMDEWNTATHTRTGLVERVKVSTMNEAEVEAQLLAFMQQYVPEKTSPMCGNSVHQDRRFMQIYMPALEAYFHYRNLDVSTLKELARRWRPEIAKGVVKKGAHQALADIEESIAEMRYYREHFLKLSQTEASE